MWADLAARFVGAADRDDVVREALTRTWREVRHTQVEVVNEPDVVLGRQRGLDGGCVKAPRRSSEEHVGRVTQERSRGRQPR